jgi:hypothetical protein
VFLRSPHRYSIHEFSPFPTQFIDKWQNHRPGPRFQCLRTTKMKRVTTPQTKLEYEFTSYNMKRMEEWTIRTFRVFQRDREFHSQKEEKIVKQNSSIFYNGGKIETTP